MKTYTPESVKQLLASFWVDEIKVASRPDGSQAISMSVEHENALGHSEYLGVVAVTIDPTGVAAESSQANNRDKAQMVILVSTAYRIKQAFEQDLTA